MRTAIFLLLLLAIAAIPGSLVPQRSADPNGVNQYFRDNPVLAPVLDTFQVFDVYSSVWFSAIYLLLFVSLIGCVIPRTWHHLKALRTPPPRTPARLARLEGYRRVVVPAGAKDASGASLNEAHVVETARQQLRRAGYRVRLFDGGGLSVSAERGYLRETGNLVFHVALLGMLIAIGIGSGFGYHGQRVVVVGQKFVNVLADYDSFIPGRFVGESLPPYRIQVDKFSASYEEQNLKALGVATDFTAYVTTTVGDSAPQKATIKVNHPLRIEGTSVYLLGNGFAPKITVRDPSGKVVKSESIPFLPQDIYLTSLGIVKVPDGLSEQLGMVGMFYPTAAPKQDGGLTSRYPGLLNPVLTLNVFAGDLGLDTGRPVSEYALNTDGMTAIAGAGSGVDSLRLTPGQTADLPDGLGTVTFENVSPPGTKDGDLSDSVSRFVSLDIRHDPSQGWMLFFALCVIGGLLTALFVPRRRVWVKATAADDGSMLIEYAALARGEDPTLDRAIAEVAEKHAAALGLG